VFSDVALRQMAREYPENSTDFGRISGVGESKLRQFGPAFLAKIAAHLSANPRQIFADDSFDALPAAKPRVNDSTRATLQAFRSGQSVAEVAQSRGFAVSTIYGHLAMALEAGESMDWERIVPPEQQQQIEAAFAKTGPANLMGAKELLGDTIEYGQLRIYRIAKAAAQSKM